MIKHHLKRYGVLCIFIFIIVICASIKYFNLSWVESNVAYTKVTINFLFPMNQTAFKEHIQLIGAREKQKAFDCSINWLNEQVVELKFQEKNTLKGQKINLVIQNAPTQIRGITKSAHISMQFKANIELVEPNTKLLVSSTHSFVVAFNTPITLQQLNKHLQSDTTFNVQSYEYTDSSGKKITDDTRFVLSPITPLENGKTYVLFLKAGMRSKSGTFLKQDQVIQLEVDQKPSITKTYPIDGDKWIGLYPRILLESKEDIVKVAATLNGKALQGKQLDSKHAYFILDDLLKPETKYTLTFQTQVASGEVSDLKEIHFTTTTLDQKRFWLDIHIGSKQIHCYEGIKCVRKIPCQIGNKQKQYVLGTYYLQGKAEVYEDAKNHLAGNYWLMISEKLGIQGTLRDSYWQPSSDLDHAQNIVISDEEASWLYDKVVPETMIILRN